MHHYNDKDLGEVTVVRGPSFLNWGVQHNIDGKTYASIEEAVLGIGYHNIMALRDSPHLGGFRDSVVDNRGRYQRVPTYCQGGDGVHVFDELGLRVPAWKLQEVADNIPNDVWNHPHRYWRRKAHAKPEHFRKLPVPGTRKYRGGRGYCRYIKTHQEIRENDFLDYDEDALEYGIKARGNRRRHNLPTVWDDPYRSDVRSNNWKRHRSTQWKE